MALHGKALWSLFDLHEEVQVLLVDKSSLVEHLYDKHFLAHLVSLGKIFNKLSSSLPLALQEEQGKHTMFSARQGDFRGKLFRFQKKKLQFQKHRVYRASVVSYSLRDQSLHLERYYQEGCCHPFKCSEKEVLWFLFKWMEYLYSWTCNPFFAKAESFYHLTV